MNEISLDNEDDPIYRRARGNVLKQLRYNMGARLKKDKEFAKKMEYHLDDSDKFTIEKCIVLMDDKVVNIRSTYDLSRFESGSAIKKKMSPETRQGLCNFYGITLDEFRSEIESEYQHLKIGSGTEISILEEGEPDVDEELPGMETPDVIDSRFVYDRKHVRKELDKCVDTDLTTISYFMGYNDYIKFPASINDLKNQLMVLAETDDRLEELVLKVREMTASRTTTKGSGD